ncbi:MAG: glycosyltransferase, partial [Calditrichaeota bacterium]|nr:glycosyltransferase [Calditrichota bacterium]
MIVDIFLVLYGLVTVALIYGAARQSNLQEDQRWLKLSVLIPAKDEEESIGACLDALFRQDYPVEDFEIIVINDQSTDHTVDRVLKRKNEFANLSCIDVSTDDNPLIGKSRAIGLGVETAKHEIIVMTDADCRPNPNWLKTIAANFTDEVGVVSGITILQTNVKNRLFAIMQSIDWIFLLGAGSAAVGMGQPISCIGSNLAFRKSLFNQIGGYKNLKFSVTEDLQLYKSLAKKTDAVFRFPMTRDILNYSLP